MPILPKSNRPSLELDFQVSPSWQRDMQKAIRSVKSLLEYLELDPKDAPYSVDDSAKFPLLVTQSYANKMVKGSWQDPLLLQVLPKSEERNLNPNYVDDAVGDLPAQVIPGLLHKYSSRALLMSAPNCAIHCRYCFRREFPYETLPHGKANWLAAWTYLESSPEIEEIIFSGGDPLFMDNGRLENLLERAIALPQIKTIRFHSRIPIVLPSRIDAGLIEIFRKVVAKKSLVMVIHSNHPHEIAGDCKLALSELKESGALLLNQSVLLKGINDTCDILTELSRVLLQSGVLPYYMHQLDRVTGTAHFEVLEKDGLKLMAELRAKLPGYLVPRYVRELSGEAHKTLISG